MLVAIAACVAFTCAKGGGDGDETIPSSTQSTGGGGTGGSAGMGGIGGMGGMGGQGNEGGTCDEMPCKLVEPQCGCADAEACTLVQGERSCQPNGTKEEGENCQGLNVCVAGNLCVNYGGLGTCRHFCNVDTDCKQPGGACVLELNNVMPPQSVCSDNCDPPSNTGCIAMGGKCDLFLSMTMQWFTVCAPTGPGMQDAPCTDSGDCALGYGCINDGMVELCRHYCDTQAPACPGVTMCAGFNTPATVGAKTYGACL